MTKTLAQVGPDQFFKKNERGSWITRQAENFGVSKLSKEKRLARFDFDPPENFFDS
jgi:predicted RNA-binding protein YlxR (DUF448 family)